MTWPEVVLAGLNMIQFVALSWIASRQQLVKRDLARVNGHLEDQLATLNERVGALHASAPPRNAG